MSTQKKEGTATPLYDAAAQGIGSKTEKPSVTLQSEGAIVKALKKQLLNMALDEGLIVFTQEFICSPGMQDRYIKRLAGRIVRNKGGL